MCSACGLSYTKIIATGAVGFAGNVGDWMRRLVANTPLHGDFLPSFFFYFTSFWLTSGKRREKHEDTGNVSGCGSNETAWCRFCLSIISSLLLYTDTIP